MNDNYIKIPNKVLKMKQLTSSDKLIYGLINSLSQKNGKTTVKNDFIGETLGITLKTVKTSLNRLKINDLITITNSNRHREIKITPVKAEITFFTFDIDPETNELLDRIYEKL